MAMPAGIPGEPPCSGAAEVPLPAGSAGYAGEPGCDWESRTVRSPGRPHPAKFNVPATAANLSAVCNFPMLFNPERLDCIIHLHPGALSEFTYSRHPVLRRKYAPTWVGARFVAEPQ